MATGDIFNHDIPAESDFGYAQAIRSADLIHVSGQLAFDDKGDFLHPDDFPAQLHRTHANMDKVLAHYNATRNQIISQTLYIVGLSQHADTLAQANLTYFGPHRPTSTVLGITELTLPGQLVEISFVVDTKLPA